MLEKEKISPLQFMILVSMFTIGTAILLIPSILVMQAKQDAWIVAVLGTSVGLLLVQLYSALGAQFPSLNIVEYTQILLGKWAGRLLSLLFLVVPVTLAALILRNIGGFLTTHIIPDTPPVVVDLLFLSVIIMGVHLGIEVLARAAQILFPWFLVFFTMLVSFVFPAAKLASLQPMLEGGLQPVLQAAPAIISFPFLELVILLMLFPHVNQKEEAKRAFLRGTLLGGCFLIVIVLLSISVLGVEGIIRRPYPTYSLAQKIHIGQAIQRIEVIVAGMWFITIFFKLSICFYSIAVGAAQLLGLKSLKPLMLPLAGLLILFSFRIAPDVPYSFPFTPTVWRLSLLTFGFFVPLVLLLLARRKKRNELKT